MLLSSYLDILSNRRRSRNAYTFLASDAKDYFYLYEYYIESHPLVMNTIMIYDSKSVLEKHKECVLFAWKY